MLSLSIAAGLSVAAIATVYRSWRTHAPAWFYSGLMLFILSCIAWATSQGWEFGTVYALCAPALLVWPFIACHQVVMPAPKNIPAPRRVAFSLALSVRHLGHALVVLIGLLATSLLVSVAVGIRLPFTDAGQLAVIIVILPLLWGLLAYHYLATPSKGRAVIIYAVLSAASLLILTFLPGLK
ncbi:hypothetical protein [Alteromonas antoniana]|uniref:hypothetical protein n=1 Tax=Alteromonas antoniana TaxID=2803813 RepID=UPI001C47E21D|nr:hypothetical protein [Alteromonas antoniana]